MARNGKTNGSNSAMRDKVVGFGEQAGGAELARYNVGVYLAECVADKSVLDVDSGAKQFAAWYDEGMCSKVGRKPAKPESMGVFVAQLKTFVASAAHRETIDETVKAYMVGKDRKAMNGKDFFNAVVSCNTGVKKLIAEEKPVNVTAKFVAERVGKPKPKSDKANGKETENVDYVQLLHDAATALIDTIKGKNAKARKDALALVIDLFPVEAAA